MLGSYLAMIGSFEEKQIFEEQYRKYKTVMYNNAYRILNDSYLAEDAVHNAFLAVIENSEKIYNMTGIERRNYLLIINRNAAYTIYGQNKREQNTCDCENAAVSSENIELDFETVENTDKIFKMLLSLDAKYSDILVLKLYYGLSDAETAEALDISVENAHVRIYRGKNKLKRLIKEADKDDR